MDTLLPIRYIYISSIPKIGKFCGKLFEFLVRPPKKAKLFLGVSLIFSFKKIKEYIPLLAQAPKTLNKFFVPILG